MSEAIKLSKNHKLVLDMALCFLEANMKSGSLKDATNLDMYDKSLCELRKMFGIL